MGALTDRIYAPWKRQNASDGGMGGVPPMQAKRWPFQASDSAGNAVMRPRASSRPEKQKTPASAINTPGAMTTVKGANDDGTNCRP